MHARIASTRLAESNLGPPAGRVRRNMLILSSFARSWGRASALRRACRSGSMLPMIQVGESVPPCSGMLTCRQATPQQANQPATQAHP